MQTPWGKSQHKTKVITGVNRYITARHGGLKVFKRLNALIPDDLRNENCWYEEDCEYCIPCMFIPALKIEQPEMYASAVKTLKNWYPDVYEKLFDVVLQPGESFKKDEKAFYEENKNNLIVITAYATKNNKVRCYATIGGQRTCYENGVRFCKAETKEFILDADEYAKRGRFGYVIQEKDLKKEVEKS